ncbi:MAG: OmpA family protein [Geminicoccaceae bacterium]
MSETGHVQRLTLPGLLSVAIILGGGFGTRDAVEAGALHSVSSLVLVEASLAQAVDQENGLVVEELPVDGEVPFSELNEALIAARSRLAELTKAAEIAKVAGELREELQSSEAENRQLKSVLSQLQTDSSDLLSARQAVERRVVELEKAAEAAAGEITRLQRELDTAREQILIAERQQVETAAEMAGLRQTTEESSEDSARLARDLDRTITELAQARSELAATENAFEDTRDALKISEEEAGVLRQQLTGSRSETDELRNRLETTENDVERFRALNAGLEQQVGVLKAAAGEATDAARLNLLAVEDRIDEINAAFALVSAEELLPGVGGPVVEGEEVLSPAVVETVVTPTARTAARVSASGGWVPRPSPPRAEIQQRLVAVAALEAGQASTQASSPLAGIVSQVAAQEQSDIQEAASERPEIDLASLTPDLPLDQRQNAIALLGKLKVERNQQGLSMTVPGALLFAVNSERIEPAAFDALAEVAKLVDIYDESAVLIVGHTDAVGDAGYNQQLSERRAALVKKYFVENFEISAERLQIQGRGEQDPISSNATADGRNTNRRVEVVILK